MSTSGQSDVIRFGAAMAGVAAVTMTLGPLLGGPNAATVSTMYLMVVLLPSAAGTNSPA